MSIANETIACARIRRAETPDAAALIGLARTSKAAWGYDAAFMKACRPELTIDAESILREPTFVIEADGYDEFLVDAASLLRVSGLPRPWRASAPIRSSI